MKPRATLAEAVAGFNQAVERNDWDDAEWWGLSIIEDLAAFLHGKRFSRLLPGPRPRPPTLPMAAGPVESFE